MASVRKLPNSRYWIACYTDSTGKQRQRSSKETDRAKALRIASHYEEAYRKLTTESQVRRVFAGIYEEIHGQPLQCSKAEAYFNSWVSRKKVETDPRTAQRYEQIVKRFVDYLGDRASLDLSAITRADVEGFRHHVSATISPGSSNIHLKILRIPFADAWRDNLIHDSPAAKVKTVKIARAEERRRPFTLSEMHRLLAHADTEWKGIILTGLYTAQRLGDVATLKWSAVDLKNEEIHFATAKTDRRFTVPIAPPLLAHFRQLLQSLRAADEAVFPNASQTVIEQGRTGTLSNKFYAIMFAAGLVKERSNKAEHGEGNRSRKRRTNELSFHCLRHTATSLLKNAGVSEAVAMDIVGHDTQAINQHYTHIDNASRRNAIRALPDVTQKQKIRVRVVPPVDRGKAA